MPLRRAFYYWQFIAAAAVPAWLLVGWSVFGSSGWELLGLLIVCPVLFVVMIAVAGLVVARRSVREARAVSWLDVAVHTAWQAVLVVAGLFTPATNTLMVFAILLGIAAFWIVMWELVTETRNRVGAVMEQFAAQASPRQEDEPESRSAFDPSKPQAGQIYRID